LAQISCRFVQITTFLDVTIFTWCGFQNDWKKHCFLGVLRPFWPFLARKWPQNGHFWSFFGVFRCFSLFSLLRVQRAACSHICGAQAQPGVATAIFWTNYDPFGPCPTYLRGWVGVQRVVAPYPSTQPNTSGVGCPPFSVGLGGWVGCHHSLDTHPPLQMRRTGPKWVIIRPKNGRCHARLHMCAADVAAGSPLNK